MGTKWNKNKRFLKNRWITCKCGCGEWIPQLNSVNKVVFYKHGHNETSATVKGSKNRLYGNGKHEDDKGYMKVIVTDDYRNNYNQNFFGRFIGEHRLVWEQYYNVCLLPWTHIHHKNEIRIDNRIENLQAMVKGDHMAHHLKLNNYYIGKRWPKR